MRLFRYELLFDYFYASFVRYIIGEMRHMLLIYNIFIRQSVNFLNKLC